MRWVKNLLVTTVAAFALANCGGVGDGPDEFLVLPTKPLEEPKSYTNLPTPKPEGRNLADQRPLADSVVALGGRASRLDSTAIPSSEQALLSAASRYGVTPNIRGLLAQEVGKKRGRSGDRLLYRLTGQSDPKGRGGGAALDATAELLRLRALGVRTPTAPPAD